MISADSAISIKKYHIDIKSSGGFVIFIPDKSKFFKTCIINSGVAAPEFNEDCFAASAKRFRCKGARAPEFIISQKIKQLPGTMENRNRQVRNVNTQGGLLSTPVLTPCSVQRYESLRVKQSERKKKIKRKKMKEQ